MALFSYRDHLLVGNPNAAHPLHENLGVIERAKECCGRMMQIWDNDDEEWRMPRECEPLICMSYRNQLCWAPIAGLGDQFLGRYKAEISSFIKNSFDKPKPNTLGVLEAMYNELNKEQRAHFMQTELCKQSELSDYICPICYDYAKKSISKCIHIDCPGCCEKCHATPLLVPKKSVGVIGGGGGGGGAMSLLLWKLSARLANGPKSLSAPFVMRANPPKNFVLWGATTHFAGNVMVTLS